MSNGEWKRCQLAVRQQPASFFLSVEPPSATMKLSAAAILSLAGLASAEVYIKEQFDDVSAYRMLSARMVPNFSTTIKSGKVRSARSLLFQCSPSKRLHVVLLHSVQCRSATRTCLAMSRVSVVSVYLCSGFCICAERLSSLDENQN